jgi:phosphoenolpyruvate carboxykinase (ATP)
LQEELVNQRATESGGLGLIGSTGLGFHGLGALHRNDESASLYQMAVERSEGLIARDGPLVVKTGVHTGRSAKDKFIVRDTHTENTVWWDNTKPLSPHHFDALLKDMLEYAAGKEIFAQDLYAGADLKYRLPVRIITEFAWHALFVRHLLIEPSRGELAEFKPGFTIIDLANFKADPARHGTRTETVIALDFTRNIVLIGGTSYAGEIKKSVFSILNYMLPERRVMPMHCSVNVGDEGDAAIFFGLSGTGKTTLSADKSRELIGDDEHGWSERGLFNFEGGCYAKMINLSAEAEPEIFSTTKRFGTVLENVVIDEVTRELDLADASLAENSRGAYPLSFIENASRTGTCGQPRNIIMLTADAFGIMPPIARLSAAQAMYHFLSGYTAKVAGTEKGVTEPLATFSTCFGAPFMPRHPSQYGNLLRDLIKAHQVDCWLVNTGWTGGAYGEGKRMPIKVTRALLRAALDGSLKKAKTRVDPSFGFEVPIEVPGIDSKILRPRETWSNATAYDRQAAKLVSMFNENFKTFTKHVDEDVLRAAPVLAQAAE